MVAIDELRLLLDLFDGVHTRSAALLGGYFGQFDVQSLVDLKAEDVHDPQQFGIVTIQLVIRATQILRKVAFASLTE